jgi:hypothetical protein
MNLRKINVFPYILEKALDSFTTQRHATCTEKEFPTRKIGNACKTCGISVHNNSGCDQHECHVDLKSFKLFHYFERRNYSTFMQHILN